MKNFRVAMSAFPDGGGRIWIQEPAPGGYLFYSTTWNERGQFAGITGDALEWLRPAVRKAAHPEAAR